MVQDGHFLFIDMMTCGSGHPIFDMGSMCSVYHMPPKFRDRRAERQITAVSAARTLFATVFLPGLLKAEAVRYLIDTAVSYVDQGIEDIEF